MPISTWFLASKDTASTKALEPGQVVEILLPPDEKEAYRDMDQLREDILSGKLKKNLDLFEVKSR